MSRSSSFSHDITRSTSQSTSSSNGRTVKRKHSTLDVTTSPERPSRSFLPARRFKRQKSANVSELKRFLIGCAHLLYVRGDNRERDDNEHLLPLLEPVKKAAAPSSDISQKDMVSLYFDEVDRSVVSQSKGKNHVFAAPDWKLMEAYLFPFIRVNSENRQFKVGRLHIKHVAFRIWEHLATEGRVTLKYCNDDEEPENVPLGDLRGWWLESDGFLPRGYSQWERCNGDVPGIFLLHFGANDA
jgi:hypothetical protein